MIDQNVKTPKTLFDLDVAIRRIVGIFRYLHDRRAMDQAIDPDLLDRLTEEMKDRADDIKRLTPEACMLFIDDLPLKDPEETTQEES